LQRPLIIFLNAVFSLLTCCGILEKARTGTAAGTFSQNMSFVAITACLMLTNRA